MTALPYNKKLLQQIQLNIGQSDELAEPIESLLKLISESYDKFESEIVLIENKAHLRTEQLIASTSRAYSFLDSLNMGFIMCDVNAEVVLTNQSLQEILSLKLDVSSLPIDSSNTKPRWNVDFIDSLLQPELHFKELIHQTLSSSKSVECNEVNYGKYVLRLFLAPIITEVKSDSKQQLGVVILVENITEQKVLERSKDDFLSIASHELRTPLTAIRGNTSLIKKYYADRLPDKDMVEMIDDIHESSTRLIDIVNDFLDVSAIEQGRIKMSPEKLLLGPLVAEVARELENMCLSKGIILTVDPSTDNSPAVFADKIRIKQVIYNLIGNAVKFTDQGTITISSQSGSSEVNILVSDTGRGMSLESQSLLFRKFQQAGGSLLTRDTTKGTGLGLYISKLIVELSGGKIELKYSEPAKGSVFSFSLPKSNS